MAIDLGMWTMDTARAHLARLYCSGCETYSRSVRVPSQAEKDAAAPLPMYPEPPRGWANGCPRCDGRRAPRTREA
jgi:hypothetical protein